MNTITLYRPIGIKELELIIDSGWTAFPPRLFWQPIFYPVLNQSYAEQIARDWNTADPESGFCGIVTQFDLQKGHYDLYEVQNVGGEIHNELWVPAEQLDTFNKHIVGDIRPVKVFFGDAFSMPENMAIKNALQIFRSI